eukprot:1530482-Rhodomonas_salina.1
MQLRVRLLIEALAVCHNVNGTDEDGAAVTIAALVLKPCHGVSSRCARSMIAALLLTWCYGASIRCKRSMTAALVLKPR